MLVQVKQSSLRNRPCGALYLECSSIISSSASFRGCLFRYQNRNISLTFVATNHSLDENDDDDDCDDVDDDDDVYDDDDDDDVDDDDDDDDDDSSFISTT